MKDADAYRWPLFAMGIVSILVTFFVAVDEFGLGQRPWFGWWDANFVVTGPYVVRISPKPGGAAALAGLINGDTMDLRRQGVGARIALTYQPPASAPTTLVVVRNARLRGVAMVGSTVWDGASFLKLQPMASRLISNIVLAACILILALRYSRDERARVISIVLLLLVGITLDPSFFVVPWPAGSLMCLLTSRLCATVASLLLIWLASTLGTQSLARNALQIGAYVLTIGAFAVDISVVVGLATASIDPLAGILSVGRWRSCLDIAVQLSVAVAAFAAVFPTAGTRRRSWFVVPLPLGVFVSALCFATPAFIHSWVANVGIIAVANSAVPAGAVLMMYLFATRA